MKFNSQICTTEEQSERLLALGLKKETADMCYQILYFDFGRVLKECTPSLEPYPPINNDRFIPAWSLHRLIELCGIERLPICFGKKGRVRIRVSHIHPTHDGRSGYNHYDSLIDCIEWLIGEGYFNKEYLDELCGKH